MKNIVQRVFLLLLCFVMIASALSLTACKKPVDNDNDDSLAIENEDMEGYEFIIYTGCFNLNKFVDDFKSDGTAATVLDEAVFRRNSAVREKFNIMIDTVQVTCKNTAGSSEGYGVIMKEKVAGDTNYDAAVLPAYDQTLLAYSGALYDMNSIPYLNLESEYWDQQAVNSMKIKDMVFFTTGEYSIDTFDSTIVMAFNKDLAQQYGINDLYTSVDEGKWTMDKWIEYSMLISDDLDGDQKYTDKDLYGSLVWDDCVYAVVHGAGERCCVADENGDLKLVFGTEGVVSAYTKYSDFVLRNHYCLRTQQAFDANGNATFSTSSGILEKMFPNNQSLFLFTTLGTLSSFRDMETDYGILPVFKYTEEQSSYYNTVSPYNARFISVPLIQSDVARTGKILETIGYFSGKYITDAYYEKTLYGTTVRDDESLPMLELIHLTRVYDLGYFYQPANINKNLLILFRTTGSSNSWATVYAALERAANAKLDTINTAFDNLAEEWKK